MIPPKPGLTLVAAMADNLVIGTGQGGLPWGKQAADGQRLRTLCDGQAILIGRRTFAEMQNWFWNQRVFVLTRQRLAVAAGSMMARGYPSLPAVFEVAAQEQITRLLVLGGGQVYQQALPWADRMELTIVHDPQALGTVYFPGWNREEWREISICRLVADAENRHDMTFLSLTRL